MWLVLHYCYNTCGGFHVTLDFRLKMTSCGCFFGSGLKLIFHWKAYLYIFAKLLFISRAEVLLSRITENKEIWSANSLVFEDNPSDKSLIFIKNNNELSIEPWETPALASDQLETYPFNKSICFLYLRKSHKRFSTRYTRLKIYQRYYFVLIWKWDSHTKHLCCV